MRVDVRAWAGDRAGVSVNEVGCTHDRVNGFMNVDGCSGVCVGGCHPSVLISTCYERECVYVCVSVNEYACVDLNVNRTTHGCRKCLRLRYSLCERLHKFLWRRWRICIQPKPY